MSGSVRPEGFNVFYKSSPRFPQEIIIRFSVDFIGVCLMKEVINESLSKRKNLVSTLLFLLFSPLSFSLFTFTGLKEF